MLHDKGFAGLQPERALRDVDAAAMARVLQINAIGPVLVTQVRIFSTAPHFRPIVSNFRKSDREIF